MIFRGIFHKEFLEKADFEKNEQTTINHEKFHKMQRRIKQKKILFLNQNICCGYAKEPSQWDGSFEHPKHMLKSIGKKVLTILRWTIIFI